MYTTKIILLVFFSFFSFYLPCYSMIQNGWAKHPLQHSIVFTCMYATCHPINKPRATIVLQNYTKRLEFILRKIGCHSHAIELNKCYNASYKQIMYTFYDNKLISGRLFLRGCK